MGSPGSPACQLTLPGLGSWQPPQSCEPIPSNKPLSIYTCILLVLFLYGALRHEAVPFYAWLLCTGG